MLKSQLLKFIQVKMSHNVNMTTIKMINVKLWKALWLRNGKWKIPFRINLGNAILLIFHVILMGLLYLYILLLCTLLESYFMAYLGRFLTTIIKSCTTINDDSIIKIRQLIWNSICSYSLFLFIFCFVQLSLFFDKNNIESLGSYPG